MLRIFSYLTPFLISLPVLAVSIQDINRDQLTSEYQEKLDESNLILKEVESTRSCPGINITLSCGNKVCEKESGENEITCPTDCLLAPIESYNSQTFCKDVKAIYKPSTYREVQSIVRYAISKKMRVRVIGKAHSTNQQLCTDGIIISTEKLNKIIGLEDINGKLTVAVEPGVSIQDLTQWLDSRNLSLGFTIMGFNGLSIGGAIATAAHGSSPNHTAVISSLVHSATLVNGRGEIVDISQNTSDLDTVKAVRANLGMLGVVVEIKLLVQPQFNLHAKVSYRTDANLRKKGIFSEINGCDFAEMNWFPHSKKVMKICAKKTTLPAHKDATFTLLDPLIPDFIIKPYKLILQYGACHNQLNKLLEDLRFLSLAIQPPFQKRNSLGYLMPTSEVIGPSHKIISSKLTRQRLFETDWEVAVPLSKAQLAIQFISKYLDDHQVYLPLFGVFIRFAPTEDTTLLAHTVAHGSFHRGEPSVYMEIPVYSPIGFPPELAKSYLEKYEGLMRLLVEKFDARAHWGKNKEWIFEREKELNTYGELMDRFKSVVRQFDPEGTFSNDFSRKILD